MGKTALIRRGVDLDDLTDKQRHFVAEYLIDYNATRAARAAGYAHPSVAGAKLLNPKLSPNVTKCIERLRTDRMEALELNGRDVLLELRRIALRDPIDLCDEDGKIMTDDLRSMPEDIRRCIDGLKIKQMTLPNGETIQQIELKLCPKIPAIELAMKHLQLFAPEQHEHVHALDWDAAYGSGKVPDEVEAAIEQA